MDSGCLCCTVRDDLAEALTGLYVKRAKGLVPQFRRVVIETTGLADPAPIIHTLMREPLIQAYFSLDGVIATVDAVNADWQLDSQIESIKQAAVADRIVLTKTDLAKPEAVGKLEQRLRHLNPGAPIARAINGVIEPSVLFDAGLYNPETKSVDVRGWLRDEAVLAAQGGEHADDDHSHDHGHDHHDHDHHGHDHDAPHLDVNRHDSHIHAHCIIVDKPFDWDSLGMWLGYLANTHGDKLLRMKAIVNIEGEKGPVALHGVQHLFHPPAHLAEWPSDDRRSRLVFITRDLSRELLESTIPDPQKLAELAEKR
jgi:G3E family GTPase